MSFDVLVNQTVPGKWELNLCLGKRIVICTAGRP